MVTGWIRTGNGASPYVGDRRRGALGAARDYLGVGVVLADMLLGHVTNHVGVVAHVLSKSRRPWPIDLLVHTCAGMHRLLPAEPCGDVYHRAIERDGDGVQVSRMAYEAKTLRLQRERPSARKRIEELGQLAIGRILHHLGVGIGVELLVADVVPVRQPADHVVEPLALGVLLLLGGEQLRVLGRVVHHAREDDATCGGKWTARPPQVERRGVPLAYRLLAHGLRVDLVQRNRGLYQFLLVHVPSLMSYVMVSSARFISSAIFIG